MNVLSKAVAISGAAAALVAGLAAPAAAVPDPCPGDPATELACIYVAEQDIVIGNPFTMPPQGTGPTIIHVTNLCTNPADPTDCDPVFLQLPGATVESTASTLVTIHLPGYGVRIPTTVLPADVYFNGIPTVTPGSPTPLGITATLWVPLLPVRTGTFACAFPPTSAGPVTVTLAPNCYAQITVAL